MGKTVSARPWTVASQSLSARGIFLHLLTNQIALTSFNTVKEQLHMFETAVQEKRTGLIWGVLAGVVAFAGLLATGYMLIT
jgi:hypothetical protein